MLPREIVREHDPERSRFDLPMRNIGPLRFIGLVPMLFAIGFVWMPGKQLLRSLAEVIAGSGSGFEWFFVVFLSVFVIAGMIPFGLGLFILAGRTRVTVGEDRLVMTELAGPIRWSRKVKLDQVERLEIGGASRVSEGGQSQFGSAMCGIVAILKDGKKMPIAIGYPRDLLQPLVGEIRSLMQRRGKVVPVAEATLPPRDEQPVTTERRMEKPAGSAIGFSTTGWSAEFKVPSLGLWKGSYGLLAFGIVWCAIVGAITAGGVFGKGPSGSWMGMAAFMAVFWAFGIGMLLLGIHLGTRRWTLRADHSQLHVTLKSALRSREWRWAAGEIADIRIGDSGTKVNERMLEQLQIHRRDGGRKTGLLTDRSHEELAWIATTLRGMLRVQTGESPEAPPALTLRDGTVSFSALAQAPAGWQMRLNASRFTGIQLAVRMNMRILFAVFAVVIAAGIHPMRADDALPLPELDGVLKRVMEQVEKEEQSEREFKLNYSYTRSKKTEFKNSKGEVKKTESKTKANDPLARRAKTAPPAPRPRGALADGPVTETQSNVRGKAFEKSDFPIGDDLISRFEFTLVRRELVNGRPALVIDFKPANRKLPEKSIKEKFLNKAAGRVWVDEVDAVPVKADLHLSAPVSVLGGLVGAVQKFTFSFNRQRTPEGIWFTVDSDWHLEGREVFVRRIIDYHEETKDVIRVIAPASSASSEQAR